MHKAKANLVKFQKMKSKQVTFLDHSEIKLKINTKIKNEIFLKIT